MSKKHSDSLSAVTITSHEQESRIIKSDLIKVLVLNTLYLAFMIVLYVTNNRNHFLDSWFAKILHF